MMKNNELTESKKKKILKEILEFAYCGEYLFRMSMMDMKDDFSFFQEKGLDFDAFELSDTKLSAFRGNVLVSCILTKLGERGMACYYLLKTSFNDFYESLKNDDDRENFAFMVYSALGSFEWFTKGFSEDE